MQIGLVRLGEVLRTGLKRGALSSGIKSVDHVKSKTFVKMNIFLPNMLFATSIFRIILKVPIYENRLLMVILCTEWRAIWAVIALFLANRIARIVHDFQMNIIKLGD